LRTGLSVVLAGRPNVGKSSLLNALAGEEAAIVAAVPGTTRDRIEKAILIDGMPVNVIDTAGLRDTIDEVESLGIARTREAIDKADLVLHLMDASSGVTLDDERIAAQLPAGIDCLTVMNKVDLAPSAPRGDQATLYVSAKTGAGLDTLRAELKHRAGLEGAGEDMILARARQLDALRRAVGAVEAATLHLEGAAPALELFAEELRLAQEALNSITGEFTPDDLLGEIFGRFCIGK